MLGQKFITHVTNFFMVNMGLEGESKNAPVEITEAEAALYDRQIRLWGLEAQQRMRNATILILKLKGVATEVIKNIVLAGVGKIIIADDEVVHEVDLGPGFFFRDDDVGRKRVTVAEAHVKSLNPLVKVETISDYNDLDDDTLNSLIQNVDLVCVTDWTRDRLIQVNNACRVAGKLFYAGGSYGLVGYIFCDLLEHQYIAPDRSGKENAKSLKLKATYTPLENALKRSWEGFSKKQTKETNPSLVFALLAIWEFESRNNGELPEQIEQASELQALSNDLIMKAKVNKKFLAESSQDLFESLATTASHEFSPVCAVVGGMLAQDILKTLSAREAPIANLFVFDGHSGGGHVSHLMGSSE